MEQSSKPPTGMAVQPPQQELLEISPPWSVALSLTDSGTKSTEVAVGSLDVLQTKQQGKGEQST